MPISFTAPGFLKPRWSRSTFPGISGKPVSNDDSGGPDFSAADRVAQLSDGYRMVWDRDQQPLKTNQPIWFRFRVEDNEGKPADLEPYMGMAGHAAFIRADGHCFLRNLTF